MDLKQAKPGQLLLLTKVLAPYREHLTKAVGHLFMAVNNGDFKGVPIPPRVAIDLQTAELWGPGLVEYCDFAPTEGDLDDQPMAACNVQEMLMMLLPLSDHAGTAIVLGTDGDPVTATLTKGPPAGSVPDTVRVGDDYGPGEHLFEPPAPARVLATSPPALPKEKWVPGMVWFDTSTPHYKWHEALLNGKWKYVKTLTAEESIEVYRQSRGEA